MIQMKIHEKQAVEAQKQTDAAKKEVENSGELTAIIIDDFKKENDKILQMNMIKVNQMKEECEHKQKEVTIFQYSSRKIKKLYYALFVFPAYRTKPYV